MTAELDQAADLEEMGPVDFFVVAFPTSQMTGEALPMLVDLVDRGIIRILDLAFIRKEQDGTVTTLSQVDLERMKMLEAVLFEGAASGLLGQDDLDEAGQALEPGTAAGVLVTRTSGRRRSPPPCAGRAASWSPPGTSRSRRWSPPSTPWRARQGRRGRTPERPDPLLSRAPGRGAGPAERPSMRPAGTEPNRCAAGSPTPAHRCSSRTCSTGPSTR